MAEKRFTIVVTGSDGSFHYWDKFTDERITSALELENKLNELNDENEQLKNDCGILVQSNQDYRKENEQLKQTMQEVAELLSEEVDLFSDKATEHDICAYVELKELDNKDAYYMAISTKKAIKMLKGDV